MASESTTETVETEELHFAPGEIAAHWYSPNTEADCSDALKKQLKSLCDKVGNKDISARRFEVEQAWEARLFARGYQYLLPRKGGGFTIPQFQSQGNNTGRRWYGYETNIYSTYLEIIRAALTRDVPNGRFEPQNPNDDADVTAADAASKYLKVFSRNNKLLGLQEQLVDYLCTDGRAVIVTDYLIDAQRFGWDNASPRAVPEDELQLSNALLYLARHGETEANAEGVMRAQDEQIDEHGETEAKKAAQYLAKAGIKRIISSPLPRAQETAQIISQETGIPVETDDRLASLDKGNLEGQPEEDAEDDISAAAENPDQAIAGGESFGAFGARVQAVLFDLLNQQSGAAAVVMHDSGITEANKIFSGEEEATPNVVAPGGIVAVVPADGGGYELRPVLGQASAELDREMREPRGQEVAEVYGKLEAKVVPINAQTQADLIAIQVSKEYDITIAKAKFPDQADAIKPGGAGAGENELDRIARINACLALEASYVTGDSMVRDCTIARTWMRPAFFMEIEDRELRKEAFECFPDGALIILAGDELVLARNEGMDDHCTVIQSCPGSGMNRIALLTKLISLQKRVNNWVDLINSFFIKTVPMKWMERETFDIQAVKEQGNEPGGVGTFARQPGFRPDQLMFIEPTPTHQPTLGEFIMYFIEKLPQLLSGALPTLFGDESNTDTVGGAIIQRDQALGRLGTPWHAIQEAMCSVYRQVAQLAAKCRRNGINESVPGEGVIQIEVADLKGNVLCYPEDDANFPESWTQRQSRFQQLMQDANNPIIQSLLALPKNLKLAKDAVGLTDMEWPAAEAFDKQLGELKILLESGPMPNPQFVQLTQQLEGLKQKAQAAVQGGQVLSVEDENALMQMEQQLQQTPQMVSTVPIDPEVEDNDSEAACLKSWMNLPEGRKYKNGTAKEREAFLNVRTHFMEHVQAAQAKKNAAVQPERPPSVSMNVKDLPPAVAAEAGQRAGLTSSTPDAFAQQDVKETIQKGSSQGPHVTERVQ